VAIHCGPAQRIGLISPTDAYDPAFIASGIEISPVKLPLRPGVLAPLAVRQLSMPSVWRIGMERLEYTSPSNSTINLNPT
jgi:hypothetical protein